MIKKETFSELRVDGNVFGSPRYFDSKRRHTVFALCDSSGGARVDCKKMIGALRERFLTQTGIIEDDLKKAGDAVAGISADRRKKMGHFLEALEKGLRQLKDYSFSHKDLSKLLREDSKQDGKADTARKIQGRNDRELCSDEYMGKITSDIFGSERISFNAANSFSNAISKDIEEMIGSVHDDLQNALRTIVRVSGENKRNMIDAARLLATYTDSFNKSHDIFNILDYEAELTMQMLSKTLVVFKSAELLRGHQAIEDYLRGRNEPRFESHERYTEIDSVEMYSYDISKIVGASLVLDHKEEKVDIRLYIGGEQAFETEYKDAAYKSYWRNSGARKGLIRQLLTCRPLTEREIRSINRQGVSGIVDWMGTGIEGAFTGIASVGRKGFAEAGEIGKGVGQAIQAIGNTIDFSKNKVQVGDFEFRYGRSDKEYGGYFCGSTFKYKEV